jgi:hypothetical protein
MSKKLLVFLMAGVLVLGGAGCAEEPTTPAGENQNVNQNINEEPSSSGQETIAQGEGEEPSETGGVKFASYANKSVGYTIDRPEGWYWRHYIQKEIGETHPGIEDYFITDPNPLPRLETEYLGRMVIEVSKKSLDEIAANVSDLTSSDTTVGGVEAKKFEGTRDNEMVKNQKVIAYHFQKDGRTFRIVYTKLNSTSEEEAVFEHLASSLTFAK